MPTTTAAGTRRIDKLECGCLSWEAVCEMSGGALTYRMLNYWTVTLGVIPAVRHTGTGRHVTDDDTGRHGSGTTLGWVPDAARRAAIVAIVISRTGMRPDRAVALVDGADVVTMPDGTDVIIAVHVIPPPDRIPATPATDPVSRSANGHDPRRHDAD